MSQALRISDDPLCYHNNKQVHFFFTGRDETTAEKLRSILAQLEFTMKIKEWDSKGILFSKHLYVPEVHPITGSVFCEMEDEGHVFKVRL